MAKETSGGQIAGNCLATFVIGFILLIVCLPLMRGCVAALDSGANAVESVVGK
jgi:hypothetical protein